MKWRAASSTSSGGRYASTKSGRGDVYMGACSMLMGGIFYGSNMAACADGTFAGAPLGNTIGARTGNAKSGLTSHLASCCQASA